MRSSWTVGRYIYSTVGVALLGLVLVLAINQRLARQLTSDIRHLGDVRLAQVTFTYQLTASFNNQRALVNQAAATLDKAKLEADLKQFSQLSQAFDSSLTSLKPLLTDVGLKAHLDKLANCSPGYRTQAEKVFKLATQFQQEQALEVLQKEVNPLQAQLDDALTSLMNQTVNVTGKEAQGVVSQTQSSTRTALWIGLALAALALGICIYVVQKRVMHPIRHVSSSLLEGSRKVLEAAGQISGTSQSLAEGASEQAASLEETSASLEEISSMTQRNAQNVQSAKEFTGQTRATAESGAHSTQEMGQAMQGIRTASSEMRDAMNGIKAASNDVGKIIKTIDEIAFQTNILALNAAVEAARAGEAGMGFAVVADEVRNLAQRSAKAAKETADMIETSIKRSDDGVRVTDKVVASVEEVTAKSQQLEQKLAEILAKAQKVDEQVAEIASASQEQSQGINEVNRAVSQMDKVTQSNASNAEESAAAAEELNAQASVLKDAVQELQKLVGGGGSELVAHPKATIPTATPATFRPNTRPAKSQPKPGFVNKLAASKSASPANDRDFPMPEPIAAGNEKNGFKDF